jgi:hypothetical protein
MAMPQVSRNLDPASRTANTCFGSRATVSEAVGQFFGGP